MTFGLGLSWRLHDERTARGCGVRPSQLPCVLGFFDHALGCKKGAKGIITQRHDPTLPILRAPVKEIGFDWGTSSQGCGFPSIAIPAAPNKGQGRLQGDKKTPGSQARPSPGASTSQSSMPALTRTSSQRWQP